MTATGKLSLPLRAIRHMKLACVKTTVSRRKYDEITGSRVRNDGITRSAGAVEARPQRENFGLLEYTGFTHR